MLNRWVRLVTRAAVLCAVPLSGGIWAGRLVAAGQDLALTYTSPVDHTPQPYRLYLPDQYRGDRSYPLVVALHGTTGDQNTFFDHPRYGAGRIKAAADRCQMLVVCPHGRGPREYRGLAEQDVFAVIAEVSRKYPVDRRRIYLCGHSMGGTGAVQIALHHPDAFAAVAPLAPAYGSPSLIENGNQTPFFWIVGGKDKEAFLQGTQLGVDRMRTVNPRMRFERLPDADHYGPVQDFDGLLSWFTEHRLGPPPKALTFLVDTPLHGQAHWVRVDGLRSPGRIGRINARIEGARVVVAPTNVSRFSILPQRAPLPRNVGIVLEIDGRIAYRGTVRPGQEVAARWQLGHWAARLVPAKPRELTDYRFTPIGTAPVQLDMHGTEATLANWIADAMRAATGSDVAIINRQYYRGMPLPAGRVDMVDILHAMNVFDWNLIVADLKGREIIAILDDNVPDPAKDRHYSQDGPDADRLAQVSGLRYAFDSHRPAGKRIVESTLEPERVYRVALEGHVAYWETLLQAGHFGKLRYRITETPLSVALYGHAARQGVIQARREGRVRDRTSLGP